MLEGVAGFGPASVLHTSRLLELSSDLPLVIEVVDTAERLEGILPRIETMMGGGLITMEKVRVIRYEGPVRPS